MSQPQSFIIGRFRLRGFVPWFTALLLAASTTQAEQGGSGGVNAPRHLDASYVVLVSLDGYRWDFADLYPSPALTRFAAGGAKAERLLPVWPTLTFPNHYSLVTGLRPANHGIVANDFYDRSTDRWYRLRDRGAVEDGRFYGGEPIWVTAESQGMVSASFFWVGSEAEIADLRPTFWRRYDKTVLEGDRVRQVLEWLSLPPERRPHLFTLYFEAIDDHAHWNGIGSEPFLDAVRRVDGSIGALLEGIESLPHGHRVYVVLVSDHGQAPYAAAEPMLLEEHIDLDGLMLEDGGTYVMAWQETPDAEAARALARTANAIWRHGRAWTRLDAPAEWQLAAQSRFPDLVFQADPGHAVVSRADRTGKISAGDHGWAPDDPAMHGAFMIRGPGIAAGRTLGAVRNIDVYPLLARLLGLRLPDRIDGDQDALAEALALELPAPPGSQ